MFDWSARRAVDFCRNQLNAVAPNAGFMRALERLEASLMEKGEGGTEGTGSGENSDDSRSRGARSHEPGHGGSGGFLSRSREKKREGVDGGGSEKKDKDDKGGSRLDYSGELEKGDRLDKARERKERRDRAGERGEKRRGRGGDKRERKERREGGAAGDEEEEVGGASTSSGKAEAYEIPDWAGEPALRELRLDIIKGGSTIGRIDVGLKSSYLIGRATGCDIVLDHASVSRQHALLVHHHTGKMMIKDLGSAHGTVVDGQRLRTGTWLELCEGSVVRFGASTKSYVARGRDLSHFLL